MNFISSFSTSLSIIKNLSFNLLSQHNSTFSTEFSDSFSLHLSKSFCSKLSLPRKFLCSKTCDIHIFHSLLPLPKERRTNRLNSFVSLFSLSKRIQRTSPKNSFDSSLPLKLKISKD